MPTNYTNFHEKRIKAVCCFRFAATTSSLVFGLRDELRLFRYPAIQLSRHPAIPPPLVISTIGRDLSSLLQFPTYSELIAQHSALSSSQYPVPFPHYPLPTFYCLLSTSYRPVPSTLYPVPTTHIRDSSKTGINDKSPSNDGLLIKNRRRPTLPQ